MTENTPISPRRRVLSGMRPTGRLHLGNYMGALYNWVQLQHQYECYFFIADWHALTTDYADPSQRAAEHPRSRARLPRRRPRSRRSARSSCRATSSQHAELNLLFGMITPLGWLERVPSYKDQQEQLTREGPHHLRLPRLSAAAVRDILLYQPDFVPVGQDQVAHVELTREVARRFNQLYASQLHAGRSNDAANSDKERLAARRYRQNARHAKSFCPSRKSC